jgi:hypothetical protein
MVQKIWDCECCQYQTLDKSDYNRHLKSKKHDLNEKGIMKIIKMHDCDKCDYKTKSKFNLNKHINRMHLNLITMQFLCLACEEYLETSQHKIDHICKKEHKDNIFEKYKECYKFLPTRTIDPTKSILFMKKCNKIINVNDKKNIPKKVMDIYEKQNIKIRKELKTYDGYIKHHSEHKQNLVTLCKSEHKQNLVTLCKSEHKQNLVTLCKSEHKQNLVTLCKRKSKRKSESESESESDTDTESESESDTESDTESDSESESKPKQKIMPGTIIKAQIVNITSDKIGRSDFKDINSLDVKKMKELINFTIKSLDSNNVDIDDYAISHITNDMDEDDITSLYGKCHTLMTNKDQLDDLRLKFNVFSKDKQKEHIKKLVTN